MTLILSAFLCRNMRLPSQDYVLICFYLFYECFINVPSMFHGRAPFFFSSAKTAVQSHPLSLKVRYSSYWSPYFLCLSMVFTITARLVQDLHIRNLQQHKARLMHKKDSRCILLRFPGRTGPFFNTIQPSFAGMKKGLFPAIIRAGSPDIRSFKITLRYGMKAIYSCNE